jgi:CheY-like chemotaxis protein
MLASIMGYNELAMERAENKNDETLARYLSEIFQASQRARDLIAQMLAFSRGSGGEPPVPVQLSPLVNDVLTMLRPVIPKTIDLAVNLDTDTPIVKVNVINFQQVVMNLALNAADAMDGRGQIAISMHHNEFVSETCTACHERIKGDFVELSITDDGPGIPDNVINHLFEPFFTTKEVGKGTGMGLSVVHGIMHELGGHIVVSNSETGGATFRLLFPTVDLDSSIFDEEPAQKAVENDLSVGPRLRSQSDTAANPRVLIVDDEESIAGFLGELLQHAGYRIDVETDSQRALVGFTRNPEAFDLVITDYSMPMMTGLEMVEAMHVLRPDLPVLLTTGFSEEIDEHNAQALGVQAFMRKPVQTAELLDCVASLLSHEEHSGLLRHA